MQSVFLKGLALSALFFMFANLHRAADVFVANLQFTAVETEVSFWGQGNYQPDPQTIERTLKSIGSLVGDFPEQPSYLNLSAAASAWLAYWAISAQEQERWLEQSFSAQFAAIRSRPAHRHSWIKLIEYLSNTNNSDETELWAKARLASLGSHSINPLRK